MTRALLIFALTAFSVPALAATPKANAGRKVNSGRTATRSFKVAGLTGKGAVQLRANQWQSLSRKAMPTVVSNSVE
ncbi:MAG: hypothetical protein AAFQ82_05425 [Myxococcota bacterium]